MRGLRSLTGAVLALFVLAGLAWFGYSRMRRGDVASDGVNANTRLTVVDVASRELDGAPAIVVTFSIPLPKNAASKNFVELYEDPRPAPAKAKSPADDPSADASDVKSAVQ